MSLNFFLANFNLIVLIAWIVFFSVVVARYLRPHWVKGIQYKVFVVIAIILHLIIGIFATWLQYAVWGKSEITKGFLSSSLSPEVPFPSYLEFLRPLFDSIHGYFIFYSFQKFFLSTVALLIVTGLFCAFLVARARYRSFNFREGDIMLIVLAMLISGWPGVIVLLPIGLIFSILFSIVARVAYDIERIPLSPAFLFASPFALLFATPILSALHLYTLLKL